MLSLIVLLVSFGVSPLNFPFTYLGLPIRANIRLAKNWRPIVEKFKLKLLNWKASTLSFEGRLTLVKSILDSLPLFYLSLFKAPDKIINNLESIRRKFLWRGKDNNRIMHWISQDTLVRPKEKSGLGIGCLKNEYGCKWLWCLKCKANSLWSSCTIALHRISGINTKPLAKCGLPGTWLSISKISSQLEEWNICIENLFERKICGLKIRLLKRSSQSNTCSSLIKIAQLIIEFRVLELMGNGVGKEIPEMGSSPCS